MLYKIKNNPVNIANEDSAKLKFDNRCADKRMLRQVEESSFNSVTDYNDDENALEDVKYRRSESNPDNKVKPSKDENSLNGTIDYPVQQGEIGDCWLISAVLSMSYNEDGSQAIEDNMNIHDNGDVDVYFPGEEKQYSVTASEIEKENNNVNSEGKTKYSSGDDDMLAIELAVDKIVKDDTVKTKYSLEEGGNPYYIFKLFGADTIKVADSKLELKQALNNFEENSSEYSMTLGVVDKPVMGLLKDHGYSVKSVDEDNVVLVNPWDSTEEISVDKDKLLDNYKNLSIVYAKFDS